MCVSRRAKDVFDPRCESICNVEGHGQARFISALLDCVDCLSGNTEKLRQILLCQPTGAA